VASNINDPFAAVAPFYDLDLEGFDDDIEMYRELAQSRGSEVLELGCGTGRVAEPLARAGLNVAGVDISAAMLELAGERAGTLPVTFVEGDMREIDLGREFDAVLVPLGALQHMETASDVVATLATVARHLAPSGLAVVDVEAPHPDDFAPVPQPLVEHWTRPWRGGEVTKLVAVEARPSLGLRFVTWHFDVQPPDGALRRVTAKFALRVITAGELELAARLAGLTVAAWYGDYGLSPTGDGDERMIALLERCA
jgi:ubiquinone/menaquinone biosynthesis C-methylase UbiE